MNNRIRKPFIYKIICRKSYIEQNHYVIKVNLNQYRENRAHECNHSSRILEKRERNILATAINYSVQVTPRFNFMGPSH